MSEPLFYCAQPPATGAVVLTGTEAHHVTVQRLRRGDRIALFDGAGALLHGNVETIDRKSVRIDVTERRHVDAPRPRLELYCALPKGDRLSVLLDMGTQLGMAAFVPLQCERSVVEPRAHAEERWRRIMLESCKQSRRLYLPEIGAAVEPRLAARQLQAAAVPLLVAHPRNDVGPAGGIGAGERLALFVGPEGGLTENEIADLRGAGARFVALGSAILRIETAALTLLALTNSAVGADFR